MRFVLKFKTGADCEFEIPEADLKRHPETMLSVMSRPRWTGSAGAPEVQQIEAPETAEDSWSDGMDAFVVAWYARTGAQAIELPAPAELEDAVAIADWLLLPLGDLSEITLGGDAADGNLARKVRAKTYIKLRKDREKTMVAITETIENAPKQKYRFIFLNRTDDATYINKAAEQPFDRFVPETWRLNADQLARTGSGESAYEWAQCETMRDETETDLEGFGFEASWKRERVELSGPRGLDFPPSDLMSVYAFRQVLTVTLPEAEPASKRRRV